MKKNLMLSILLLMVLLLQTGCGQDKKAKSEEDTLVGIMHEQTESLHVETDAPIASVTPPDHIDQNDIDAYQSSAIPSGQYDYFDIDENLRIPLANPVFQTVSERSYQVPDGHIDVDGLAMYVNEWESPEDAAVYYLICQNVLTNHINDDMINGAAGQLSDLYFEEYHFEIAEKSEVNSYGDDLFFSNGTIPVNFHKSWGTFETGEAFYKIGYWPKEHVCWNIYIISANKEKINYLATEIKRGL